jgi:hypothetical protein
MPIPYAVLVVAAFWFGISLPVAIFAGKFIKQGQRAPEFDASIFARQQYRANGSMKLYDRVRLLSAPDTDSPLCPLRSRGADMVKAMGSRRIPGVMNGLESAWLTELEKRARDAIVAVSKVLPPRQTER